MNLVEWKDKTMNEIFTGKLNLAPAAVKFISKIDTIDEKVYVKGVTAFLRGAGFPERAGEFQKLADKDESEIVKLDEKPEEEVIIPEEIKVEKLETPEKKKTFSKKSES